MEAVRDFFDALLAYTIVFGPSVLSSLWFIISLILFIKRDKQNPGQTRKRKIMLIISGVLAFIFVCATFGIIISLMIAIQHM